MVQLDVKDVKKYKMLMKELKQRNLNERLGKQQTYESQSNLFKPIIDTAKETSKDLQQQIVDDRINLNNVLVPMANQLSQAINEQAAIQAMPFYNSNIQEERYLESTPKKDTSGTVFDLDKLLNETDKENLQDMSLPLPSEVIKQGNYDSVLEKIKTLNRQCGQFTSKASTKDEKEKEIYKSRRKTLESYKISLETHRDALKYKTGEGLKRKKKLVKPKRGRGRPQSNGTVVYNTPDELIQKLTEYMSAYNAGNNGVYNTIVSILDELLKIKEITKQEYDSIYDNNLKI